MKGIVRKLRNFSLLTVLFVFSETQVDPRNGVGNEVGYDICVRLIFPSVVFYCYTRKLRLSPIHGDVDVNLYACLDMCKTFLT